MPLRPTPQLKCCIEEVSANDRIEGEGNGFTDHGFNRQFSVVLHTQTRASALAPSDIFFHISDRLI